MEHLSFAIEWHDLKLRESDRSMTTHFQGVLPGELLRLTFKAAEILVQAGAVFLRPRRTSLADGLLGALILANLFWIQPGA
jgi:hypothetical protein